MSTSLGTNM